MRLYEGRSAVRESEPRNGAAGSGDEQYFVCAIAWIRPLVAARSLVCRMLGALSCHSLSLQPQGERPIRGGIWPAAPPSSVADSQRRRGGRKCWKGPSSTEARYIPTGFFAHGWPTPPHSQNASSSRLSSAMVPPRPQHLVIHLQPPQSDLHT